VETASSVAETALFLLVGFGAPVALHLLIRDETREPREMDRADAESYTRRRSRERHGGDARDGRDRR
jgi:hypothetical protein